ncbi:MAG: alpha-hydroxy-acid oxidizing protein [Desulfovibrionaceae bacterium]|jgi:isopentenyl diphosphate isomerase/L-lactate dehydrogenase-like FMN-dependent dehydrogenase|nr:alpha-hydroxy-acid oxidizing protein [Desulfovibrionaceae bacterium]
MNEIREKARKLMKGHCRVCPVCDGRACRGEVPGMGGMGTGSSFMNNVEALSRVRLDMRLVHSVTDPDTSCELFGWKLALPVLAAPIGGVSFNMGGGMEEGAYTDAVVGGCADAGAVGCTGDGVPDIIHQSGFASIRANGGRGIPFIKPWEDEELFRKLEGAVAAGAGVVGMDIDAAGLVTLAKMGRPVSPKSAEKLAKIVERACARLIIKGIMTVEDARGAVDAGAAAIVVSNHGGRVLDHTPGTCEVLPAIAEAVGGKVPVLVDGGVRTGVDVLKMLALGADAVLIGRPVSVAALGGGREGVAKYFNTLKGELVQAMVLTGCQDLAAIDGAVLHDE